MDKLIFFGLFYFYFCSFTEFYNFLLVEQVCVCRHAAGAGDRTTDPLISG